MNNKEITAIEWFYTKLITGKFTGNNTIEFLYETAKEMEKLEKNNYICIKCKFKIDEEMHKVSD
jgi:hypothetical protein